MRRLIRYAGYDPADPDYGHEYRGRVAKYGSISRQRNSLRALRLFRSGKDTLDIAKAMHVQERTVVRWLDKERNFEYEARKA